GVSYTEENPNIVNGQSSLYGINDNNVNYTEENPNIINGQSSLYGLNDNNVVYKEEKPNIVNGQSSLFTAKAELDEAPLDVNMGGKSDSVSVDNNGLNMSDINVSSFINDNA